MPRRSPPAPIAAVDPTARRALGRLNARVWGITFGLVAGLLLFAVTNFLVLRDGPGAGPHLALLGVYLPGYRVSFGGSLIGFVYAFVLGYAAGRVAGMIYGALADR